MTKFIRMQEPLSSGYSYGSSEPLSKWDLEAISDAGVELAIYSYFSGSYEGNGTLICKRNNKWYYFDMSHCSCNGPLEDFNNIHNSDGHDTLLELLDSCSAELRTTIYALVSSCDALSEEELNQEQSKI